MSYQGKKPNIKWYEIDLNQQNRITLFPAKQSLEDFFKEFCDSIYPLEEGVDPVWEAVKATVEWTKKNNGK